MNRVELIKELAGEDIAELVAIELDELQMCLLDNLNNDDEGMTVFSFDEEEERKSIEKMVEAIKLVRTMYR